MSGLSARSVAVLVLLTCSLVACSAEEGGRPGKDDNPGENIRLDGGGPLPRAHGEGVVPIARTDGRLKVERAVLSSAGDTDLVQAKIGYRGSWMWPRCSLLEGPDVGEVRETLVSRGQPRGQGFTRALWEESLWDERESPWADGNTIEKTLLDDGTVFWTFREDPKPDREPADPRRTPFFVRCTAGDLPGVAQDVVYVVGTPREDARNGS